MFLVYDKESAVKKDESRLPFTERGATFSCRVCSKEADNDAIAEDLDAGADESEPLDFG